MRLFINSTAKIKASSSIYLIVLFMLFTHCDWNVEPPELFVNYGINGYNDSTFFKTKGTEILNRQGEAVVIRGFGLGGWLMPEGYMFNMPGDFGPTRIREEIELLIGQSETDRWFEEFRTNYVQEWDIVAMKQWGADHIRIPFNHKILYDLELETFNEREFERLDEVLMWCKRHRMDVILDMHGAPGAQSNKEIADSDGEARLWTEYETYMPHVIAIWTEIARRYKDETIIIGYDLLNEPVTPNGYGAQDVLKFHMDLIPKIREIDTNHILFINGNYFSTTFDLLDQIPANFDNVVFSFHKYWNATDQGTINYLLALREQTNTPLWLGESGENSNTWFYEVTTLVESFNIGWNWWTHKKLGTITAPLSIPRNENYDKVTEYWKGNGLIPSYEEARDGLFQMVEDIKFKNTELRPGVIASLFSPEFNTQQFPYTQLNIPGVIPAAFYDIGNNGVSYYDTEYMRVFSDENQNNGNNGWALRNDGVDIEISEVNLSGYAVGFIDSNEWLEYTVEIKETREYTITARVASTNSNGKLRVKVGKVPVGADVNVESTGSYQAWRDILVARTKLEAGTKVVRIEMPNGGFNLSQLNFE